VTRRYVPLLLLLTALWGSSYLEPATLMCVRLALAAAVLVPLVLASRGVRRTLEDVRRAWRSLVVLGAINAAVPFTLIAWGQKHIDSGIAAIANASVPIFVALLAIRYRPSERATGSRLVGIVAGLVGVAILAGVQPEGGWWAVAGTLAVVVASFLYGVSALYAQTHVERTDSLVLVTGSTVSGMLLLAPLAIVQAPNSMPGWDAWASVAVLGVGGMALGQLVYYWMIEAHGSTRAALVTYLLPVMALFLGVVVLDEKLTVSAIAGLVLILTGVALGSGVLGAPRRRSEPAPAAHSP